MGQHQRKPQSCAIHGSEHRVARASAQGLIDLVAHISVSDPTCRIRGAKLFDAQIRFGAQRLSTRQHSVVKGEMLERMQRILVDEHPDRPLIRKYGASTHECAFNGIRR